ncbi:ComEA family DNA-binding protein [Frigoribacterium sp. VKM Ac-2836]|uniref:ComEA family DNA-binding protein n=1 Tax=Frigoribacterium sp. VKM Ac-2836 TaxID=2739014 RepID=UPI001564BAFA|nr:ComEA family DNA-binding protein [Frigoribacterium sp. VKM Ac-2836]NRD25771.1 ComEA family DNA-binding protein [Frigoribacterium sp. VKM Ac-2836]
MTVSFRTAVDPSEPGGPRWRVGLGAVVVLLLVVLAVSVAVSAFATRGGAADAVVTVAPGTGAEVEAAAGSGTAPPGGAPVVFVHVHGQVASPGLFELPTGARVVDVVAAAGGFTAEADQAAVNLARVLVDGEQLRVPAVGEVADDGASGEGGAAGGSAPGAGVAAGGGTVDLNLADEAALRTLPGVGPATAAAILSWRDDNGRFRSVDDLLGVPGIGAKTLEKLRDRVRV